MTATDTPTSGDTAAAFEPGELCQTDHIGLAAGHPRYECCDRCNYDTHRCHFCGDPTSHGSGDVHPACQPDLDDLTPAS